MFFLKKIISYFILPPGVFIILFLVIGLLAKRGSLIRKLSLSGALSLYLLSVEPFKDLIFYPLEKPFRNVRDTSGDVIVVLGGGSYGSGFLKVSTIRRLIAGYILHKKTGKPLILSGGSPTMGEFLKGLGVDPSQIILDINSRDTRENALGVKRICERIKCRKVILVTSAFHMRRATRTFRTAGLDVAPYPTDFRSDLKYNLFSLFPKYSVLYDSSTALREYLGLIFYNFVYGK